MMGMLFMLLCGHAVADFCLQTDSIARGKNRHSGPPKQYDPRVHGPTPPSARSASESTRISSCT